MEAVIVIEDDADLRNLIIQGLSDEDFVVLSAENGRVALDLLGTVDYPCLLLVDLMMPVLSGWELLEELKTRERLAAMGHQVIVISASTEAERTARDGKVDLLKKPFRLDELIQKVESVCTRVK